MPLLNPGICAHISYAQAERQCPLAATRAFASGLTNSRQRNQRNRCAHGLAWLYDPGAIECWRLGRIEWLAAGRVLLALSGASSGLHAAWGTGRGGEAYLSERSEFRLSRPVSLLSDGGSGFSRCRRSEGPERAARRTDALVLADSPRASLRAVCQALAQPFVWRPRGSGGWARRLGGTCGC
jgi:hypothetical protein